MVLYYLPIYLLTYLPTYLYRAGVHTIIRMSFMHLTHIVLSYVRMCPGKLGVGRQGTYTLYISYMSRTTYVD